MSDPTVNLKDIPSDDDPGEPPSSDAMASCLATFASMLTSDSSSCTPSSLASIKFTDDDGAPASLPETGEAGEQSKIRVLLGLLKKLMGVSDIANLRLSLPASLMEPIPNLEYWQYADRPDFFAAIGDSPDELERFLSVLRWGFSKELKFVRAKLGKPYNSALGEYFRCHWSVPPVALEGRTREPVVRTHIYQGPKDGQVSLGEMSQAGTPLVGPVPDGAQAGGAAGGRDDISVRSLGSTKSGKANNNAAASTSSTTTSSPNPNSTAKQAATGTMKSSKSSTRSVFSRSSKAATSVDDAASGMAGLSVSDDAKVPVVFLCEQVCHHPPISSAYYGCPDKGIEAVGVDQINAKVSGITIQVAPGSQNKGIFIKLSDPSPGAGEEYRITHPTAQVNGIVKGTFYGTIGGAVYVTGSRGPSSDRSYRAIIEYRDESWIGKPKYLLEGVVYWYDPEEEDPEEYTKIKQVPSDRVVGNLEGAWRKQIKWRKKGDKVSRNGTRYGLSTILMDSCLLFQEWRTLIDMEILDLVPKEVRPVEEQEEMESRRLWDPVTQQIMVKNWGEATKQKQVVEQRQRDKAAQRKKTGEE